MIFDTIPDMELGVKTVVSHTETRRTVRKNVGVAKVAVMAIVALLACPNACAWAFEVNMYELDLPQEQRLQTMKNQVALAEKLTDEVKCLFHEMEESVAYRKNLVESGVSNDFSRVAADSRAVHDSLVRLNGDLCALRKKLYMQKRQVDEQERRNGEKMIARMKALRLPKIAFAPPNTLGDALSFLAEATRSESSDAGFAFMFKSDDRFLLEDGEESVPLESLVVPKIEASDISSYDALRLVCEAVGCKWNIEDGVVVVRPMGAGGYPDDWITRTYTGVDLPARDWTHWVEANGVKLPEGTSILHSPESMQLRVSSTREIVERIEKLLESDVDKNYRDTVSNGGRAVK